MSDASAGASSAGTSSAGDSGGAVAQPSAAVGIAEAQAVRAANDNGSAPAEARHRLKIDGQEHELPLSEIIALAQRSKGSELRFEQAAQQRQQVEALLQRLPEDPVAALAQLVGDKSAAARSVTRSLLRDPEVREHFETALLEHMEYEQLPASERRRVDAERDAEQRRAAEERELRRKAARADEYETQRYEQTLEQEFASQLQQAGVPATRQAIARMAWYAEQALAAGERTTARAIAERVRDELRTDVEGYVRGLDVERLEQLLGPASAQLQKRAIAAAAPRAPLPERQPGQGKRAPEAPVVERRRVGTSQFFKRIRGEG